MMKKWQRITAATLSVVLTASTAYASLEDDKASYDKQAEELKDKSNALQSKIESLSEEKRLVDEEADAAIAEHKSMRAALDNLNGCWKGPAWAAMMYKWTQIEANILKSQEAVNRSVVALKNTINYYDEGENTNKTTGSSLGTGSQSSVYVE